MIGLVEIIRALFDRRGRAPGKAIVCQTESPGKQERETEYYQLPGFASRPTPGDRGVAVQTLSGRVIVASHNYRVEVDAEPGEVKVYSTDADGGAVQSLIHLKGDGTIEINGDSKPFVTHAELDAALSAYASGIVATLASGSNGGGPVVFAVLPPSTIDITAAATTTVKTGG